MPGRRDYGDDDVDVRDPFVLLEGTFEEVLRLYRVSDEYPLSREFDERRNRVMIGDRRGIPIDERTGIGVEELCVNLFVLIHGATVPLDPDTATPHVTVQ